LVVGVRVAFLLGFLCLASHAVATNIRYGVQVIVSGFTVNTNLTVLQTDPDNGVGGSYTLAVNPVTLTTTFPVTGNGAYTFYPYTNTLGLSGTTFAVKVRTQASGGPETLPQVTTGTSGGPSQPLIGG